MSVRVPTLAAVIVLSALPGLTRPSDVAAQGTAAIQEGDSAIQALRERANKGDPDAQYGLAVAYDTGQGLPRDYAQAVAWYRKAADQGDARAQYNLAAMYAEGQGVLQDLAQAVVWYTKAADQGDVQAQFNLALLYNNGQGALKDLAEAHKWLDLAASRASGDDRAMYARARDTLAERMSPAQIADAAQRARVWQQAFDRKKP